MAPRRLSPATIALAALLIALTTVLTFFPRIPLPAGGYFNFSDAIITFAGFVFGPWLAMIAGGVGTALADLYGYPQYAPFSLVAHGLEGLLIGLVAAGSKSVPRMLAGWLLGALAMVVTYFLADWIVLTGGTNWAPSVVNLPFNIVQAVGGLVVGLPLTLAIRQAYPQIEQLGRRRKWTE